MYIFTLDGSSAGYKYIFTLDPKGLLNPEVWVYAFGQAFFSLSVAGNGSVIYGSYLPKDEDIFPLLRVTLRFLILWRLCWLPSLSSPPWRLFWARGSARSTAAPD